MIKATPLMTGTLQNTLCGFEEIYLRMHHHRSAAFQLMWDRGRFPVPRGDSLAASKRTKITRKSLVLGCCAVFAELIWTETRRRPQGILPYFQGLQRSIRQNQPVKTGRGSAPSVPDPTRRNCRSPLPRRCHSGWQLCRPAGCACRSEGASNT